MSTSSLGNHHWRFTGKHRQWVADMAASDGTNRRGSDSRNHSNATKGWWPLAFTVTASGAQWERRCQTENQLCPDMMAHTKQEKHGGMSGCPNLVIQRVKRYSMGSLRRGECTSPPSSFCQVSYPVEISLLIHAHDIFDIAFLAFPLQIMGNV